MSGGNVGAVTVEVVVRDEAAVKMLRHNRSWHVCGHKMERRQSRVMNALSLSLGGGGGDDDKDDDVDEK
jgi:hypothetical protein